MKAKIKSASLISLSFQSRVSDSTNCVIYVYISIKASAPQRSSEVIHICIMCSYDK